MKRVIDFLRKLGRNNDKEWFAAHKEEYRAAQAEFEEFTAALIDGIASFDDTVRGLTVKDCTYRIYRDTRFSNNKLPYKTHMGAYVCKGGKKSGNAGYYFHVEPPGEGLLGGHFMTAGLYLPEPAVLRSIREDICYNGGGFTDALGRAEGFTLSEGNPLKRVPQGFPADSPYSEYLKMRDIYVEMPMTETFLLAPDIPRRAAEAFSRTHALVDYLNRAADYARENM